MTGADGTVVIAQRGHPPLKKDAYPSVFQDQVKYLSTEPSQTFALPPSENIKDINNTCLYPLKDLYSLERSFLIFKLTPGL